MRVEQLLSDAEATRLLATERTDDLDVAGDDEAVLAGFVDAVRIAAGTVASPVRTSDAMTRLFVHGTVDPHDVVRGAVVDPRTLDPHHHRSTSMHVKHALAGLTLTAKVVLIGGVAAAAAGGAAASGRLPAGLQDRIASIVESVTPLNLPGGDVVLDLPASPGDIGLDVANSTPGADDVPDTLPAAVPTITVPSITVPATVPSITVPSVTLLGGDDVDAARVTLPTVPTTSVTTIPGVTLPSTTLPNRGGRP